MCMMTSNRHSFHLAELFDFLEGVLAWVKDRQGRYLWVNRAFLLKYALDHPGADSLVSAEKILGKTDYDLSAVFMADQFRLDDEQVLSGHRIINRIERVGEFEGMTAWNITNKIQSATGFHFQNVAAGVRAAVPGQFSSDAAKISAEAPAAHFQPRLDLHERIVVRGGLALWLRGSKPLHPRIPAAARTHASRISRTLQTVGWRS